MFSAPSFMHAPEPMPHESSEPAAEELLAPKNALSSPGAPAGDALPAEGWLQVRIPLLYLMLPPSGSSDN